MVAAFITSSLFLISYVVYHAQVGSVRFPMQGASVPFFTILATHGAGCCGPPLAIITLRRGLRADLSAPAYRPLDTAHLALRSVTGRRLLVLLTRSPGQAEKAGGRRLVAVPRPVSRRRMRRLDQTALTFFVLNEKGSIRRHREAACFSALVQRMPTPRQGEEPDSARGSTTLESRVD